MTGVVEQSGITAWVAQNGQVVYFFSQLAFWLLLVLVLAWAAWQFHRYVSFVVGKPAEGALDEEEGWEAEADEEGEKAVTVEEFVE